MTALAGLLPVFILLGIGAGARRFGIVTAEAANGLNRLIANVALPALLLLTIGTSPLDRSLSPRLMAACFGLVAAIAGVGWWVARAWGLPPRRVGVLAQAAMRGNLAYVSFPVILAARGEAGLRLAAVTAAPIFPLMNLLGVVVLEAARGERERVGRLMLRVAASPLVVSSLLGLVLASVGWRPWTWLAGTLKILADFALPGALLTLGAQLSLESWHGVWKPAVAATALKLVALPALAFAALAGLGLAPLEVSVGVLLLAAPTAIASYPVAAELGGDTDLAGACVLATTVAALPVYTLLTLLLPA